MCLGFRVRDQGFGFRDQGCRVQGLCCASFRFKEGKLHGFRSRTKAQTSRHGNDVKKFS